MRWATPRADGSTRPAQRIGDEYAVFDCSSIIDLFTDPPGHEVALIPVAGASVYDRCYGWREDSESLNNTLDRTPYGGHQNHLHRPACPPHR